MTSRLCSQLQELKELPTSPLRMWSSSKKHQLLLTFAPGPGVEPGSRGHKADALPLSYPHILNSMCHKEICFVTLQGLEYIGVNFLESPRLTLGVKNQTRSPTASGCPCTFPWYLCLARLMDKHKLSLAEHKALFSLVLSWLT